MSPEPAQGSEPGFVADRMLGTLTRYLRFMGYDTISANGFSPGNAKEDTLLLEIATREHRVLLTRDHELAGRGSDRAVLVDSDDVLAQVRQLVDLGIITRRCLMTRCSLCNTVLRPATAEEISGAAYAPRDAQDFAFFWCGPCKKLYWNGSHGKQLSRRIGNPGDGDPDTLETG
ncbi:MAG: Mut7-C RNAse domain-containing protein [Methanoregula sp.]|jgi:hypothetical protein